MRILITRPQPQGERTAKLLRSRGHEVLVASLLHIEPVAADLSGQWSAIAITSSNTPAAISNHTNLKSLLALPLFAVGDRSADAAREAGFQEVHSADGNAADLARFIAGRHATGKAPLLYLAGEDRAGDFIADLFRHGVSAELRIVYHAVTVPFPSEILAALADGAVDTVFHFSKRSAEAFLAGVETAGIRAQALDVRHVCLSKQVAEPLAAAGARDVFVAAQPHENALLECLERTAG